MWSARPINSVVRHRKNTKTFFLCRHGTSASTADQHTAVLHEEWRKHQTQNGRQLDQDVQRWTGGVLERVAYCVTDDCSLVYLRPLAAKIARLDVFFGVIPGAATVGGGDRQHTTSDQ